MLTPKQKVKVDVSGLQRRYSPVVLDPIWVLGIVSEVDDDSLRVTVELEEPLDGKARVRVAPTRVRVA